MHSTLKNTSDVAVKLNRSRLPWTSPSWLGVEAITADGEMLPRPPPPAEISVIEGAPSEIVINPGEMLEGNVDLASGPLIPIGELLKNVDIFLVWSYSLDISAPGENPFFSGITLLKRRS